MPHLCSTIKHVQSDREMSTTHATTGEFLVVLSRHVAIRSYFVCVAS